MVCVQYKYERRPVVVLTLASIKEADRSEANNMIVGLRIPNYYATKVLTQECD